jgi:hypothetical protein
MASWRWSAPVTACPGGEPASGCRSGARESTLEIWADGERLPCIRAPTLPDQRLILPSQWAGLPRTAAQARQSLEQLELTEASAASTAALESAAQKQLPFAEFLADLLAAETTVRRERYLRPRTRPYDRLAATAFFTLISARCERGSTITTSSKASASGVRSSAIR